MMNGRMVMIILLMITSTLIACKGRNKQIVVDTTITTTTGFNNLFLDSTVIVNEIAKEPSLEKFQQHILDFYKLRNYQFAWFDSSGLAEQAHNLVNLVHAGNDDLDSLEHDSKFDRIYDQMIADSASFKGFDQKVIHAELMFTGEFFNYASKKYGGIDDIDATELGWFIPRKKVDLTKMLADLIRNKALGDTGYAPQNKQYGALRDQLNVYEEIAKRYPADTLPYPAKLIKPGERSSLIPKIRERLSILGDLRTTTDTSVLYDIDLESAVKDLQERTGLLVDGVIGRNLIAQLNIPINDRIKQILVNIERARWMPAESDSDHLFVNIPEFMLHAYEKGEHVFDMPVIVGKEGTSTVIFNGKLKYVVFAPYWNVPESIVKNELLPKMKKDPYYLESQNMEIVKDGTLPTIRQRPGPGNSLGQIKFLFPNNYNIYLHDTPNKELFSQTRRNFSHGCIRVADPPKLAEFLLRDQPKYEYLKITELMNGFEEKWVTLTKPVPVFITYFTAWVDRQGKLNFRRDIYGHDKKMAEKLFIQ